MRAKHTALILTAGFLTIPTITLSQGPGGRPGGDFGGRQWGGGGGWQGGGSQGPGFGGGGQTPGMGGEGGRSRNFDPDRLFDMMARGKEVINVAELDPFSKGMFDRFAGRLGLTGNTITREQFRGALDKAREMTANGQMGPGGSGVGGPGGSDGDRRLDDAFKRMDKNEDGVLDNNEMSETLRNERDKYDPDHNGHIDLNEFRKYVEARRGDNESDRDRDRDRNADGPRRPRGEDGADAGRDEERKRPTSVIRAGNLPRDFPYAMLDKDGDGQIGLYEWKEYGRPISQFLTLDLNNDGFMTVDEYYRWKRQGDEQAAKANGTSTSQFGRFGGMPGGMNPGAMAMNPGMTPSGNRWGGAGGMGMNGFGGITGMGMMPQGQWNPGGRGSSPMGMNFQMGGDRNGSFRGMGMAGGGMPPGGFGMTGGGTMPGGMSMPGGGFRGMGMPGGGAMPGAIGTTGGGPGMNFRGDRGPGGNGSDRGPRGMNSPGGDRGTAGDRGPRGDRGPGGDRAPGGRDRGGFGGDNSGSVQGQGNGDRGPGGPGGRRRPGG